MQRTLRNILISRTDKLGDVVLTLPLLPILKKHFPEARLTMLLSSYTAELAEGNHHLDKILLYDREGRPRPFAELVTVIRDAGFDASFVVRPTLRVALLVNIAGIPIRVGTGYRWYSLLFNRRIYEHRKTAEKHEVEYNLGLLRAVGIDAGNECIEFSVTIPPEAERRIRSLRTALGIEETDRVVVLHPGSRGSARDWGASRFRELANRLSAISGMKVIVTGGKGEQTLVEEVSGPPAPNRIPLANQLTLKEFAALVRSADVFVANSTGPLHIAAVVGVPVVGLYPNLTVASPRRWGPYTEKKRIFVAKGPLNCRSCLGGSARPRRGLRPCECMGTIEVSEVVSAVEELLQKSA